MHAYFPILKYCLQNLVKSEATEHKQDKLFLDPKQVNYRSLKKKQNLGINFILLSLTLMGWGDISHLQYYTSTTEMWAVHIQHHLRNARLTEIMYFYTTRTG